MTQHNMKILIKEIFVPVPFHADAATHDNLARKVNEKLHGGYELHGLTALSEGLGYQTIAKPVPQISITMHMKRAVQLRTLFAGIGGALNNNGQGIRGIPHPDKKSTRPELGSFGLAS